MAGILQDRWETWRLGDLETGRLGEMELNVLIQSNVLKLLKWFIQWLRKTNREMRGIAKAKAKARAKARTTVFKTKNI